MRPLLRIGFRAIELIKPEPSSRRGWSVARIPERMGAGTARSCCLVCGRSNPECESMKRLMMSMALCGLTVSPLAAAEFWNFTPLPTNVAAGSLPESKPFQLSNPLFRQRSIASRQDKLAAGQFDSGAWDMIAPNATGTDAGRYLFSVFETGQAGIHRTDLQTGTTNTIWASPAASPALNSHVAFDASRWTPWGTYLTAEESWRGSTGSNSVYGRLFELTNPLADLGSTNLVHRNIISRVSHEGLAFDRDNSLYYIDELNGGSIYKYVSDTPHNGSTFFDAGVNYVMRVGDGNTANATGAYSWVPFTSNTGAALAGGINYTDPNGVTSADARFTTNLAAFKGTDYQRPEDLEIQTLANGDQILYFAATTTHDVFSLNLATNTISRFLGRSTINESTGLAVGNALTNPDNLAIDAQGNIYVIEDQPGGVADIWFARDANRDGVAESMARWASMSTLGAEPTGLYFDMFNSRRAWVNVQHPDSGDDRLIEIQAVPEPGTWALMSLAGLGLLWKSRRKSR